MKDIKKPQSKATKLNTPPGSNKKLAAIGKEIKSGTLEKTKNELDLLDIKIGIAEEKISYNNSPDNLFYSNPNSFNTL